MQRLIQGTLTAMIIAAMFAMPAIASPLFQDSQAIITSPANGQTVSGLVPIFGTATSSDFSRYEIAFSTDPGDAWQIFATADIVLTNAQIGVWDATNLAPGTYQVRLQVFRSDGSFTETFVRGLIVGTPFTPTPQETPTDLPPAPTFEPESVATIQPTVIIEQPPAATSTPDAIGGGATQTGAGSQREQGGGLDLSRFTSACVNGIWCAVGAYLLLGALATGRWGVRRILKQMRDRSGQS
jgi:hypothetical protein